jgi:hypothetical protein
VHSTSPDRWRLRDLQSAVRGTYPRVGAAEWLERHGDYQRLGVRDVWLWHPQVGLPGLLAEHTDSPAGPMPPNRDRLIAQVGAGASKRGNEGGQAARRDLAEASALVRTGGWSRGRAGTPRAANDVWPGQSMPEPGIDAATSQRGGPRGLLRGLLRGLDCSRLVCRGVHGVTADVHRWTQ